MLWNQLSTCSPAEALCGAVWDCARGNRQSWWQSSFPVREVSDLRTCPGATGWEAQSSSRALSAFTLLCRFTSALSAQEPSLPWQSGHTGPFPWAARWNGDLALCRESRELPGLPCVSPRWHSQCPTMEEQG